MKVIKSTLPESSVLNQTNEKYDYVDSFQCAFIDNKNKLSLTDISSAFFSSSPSWADKLMRLRNKIVTLFGLKTSKGAVDKRMALNNFKCEVGEQIGIFKVLDKRENEIILGEDDKHLDFRVSLYLDKSKIDEAEKTLIISTIVIFNNWFGRLYFFLVRPFHKLIVSTMLKKIILQLEQL